MGCCCKKNRDKTVAYDDYNGDITDNLMPNSYRSSITSSDGLSFITSNYQLTDFEKLKLLGRGNFGKVVLVKLNQTKELYAMKILKKKDVVKKKQLEHTKTERVLLEKLDHPFIVKLRYAFQDKLKLYFITDFMPGGELFFHLAKHGLYRDQEVIFYTSEIICAIQYMHENNYIYRDLKPENILIDKFGHIKITDFGLSKILEKEKEKTYTLCGTPQYLAPEILFQKGYDKSCDFFSLGVLIYEMLCGHHPFPTIGKKIDLKVYFKPLNFPRQLSPAAKELIMGLIEPNPKNRLGYNSIEEIKRHHYFKNIDFEMVEQKAYQPPFVPKLKSDEDLRYFDKDFTGDKIESLPRGDNASSFPNNDDFIGFSFQPKAHPQSNDNQ